MWEAGESAIVVNGEHCNTTHTFRRDRGENEGGGKREEGGREGRGGKEEKEGKEGKEEKEGNEGKEGKEEEGGEGGGGRGRRGRRDDVVSWLGWVLQGSSLQCAFSLVSMAFEILSWIEGWRTSLPCRSLWQSKRK